MEVNSYFKKDIEKKPKNKRGISKSKLKKLNKEVVERDQVCQNPFCQSGWPLQAPHHIVFRSAGGKDKADNLVLLCVHCHRLVHDEWINIMGAWPELEFIDKRR